MNNRILCICLLSFVIVLIFISDSTSSAEQRLNLESNLSLWYNFYEESENGVKRAYVKEPAADVTSGFNLKQGRVILDYFDTSRLWGANFQVRLEQNVAILDCFGVWKPSQLFNLYLGQMKVPSTYETLDADDELDFISRANLSSKIVDWSLSRVPYTGGHVFRGNRSYSRDVGIGIKGKLDYDLEYRQILLSPCLSYFLMIGNGLGANLFIGNGESREFIITNELGDYFYSTRLNFSPFSWLSIGGHYSLNKHQNMLFNSGRDVYELDRTSWSTDFRLVLSRVKLVAMYGSGQIDDNYFYTEQRDFEYQGWETKLLFWLVSDYLQLGSRYDKYTRKYFERNLTEQNNLTFGINFIPIPDMRLQLNYIIKETESQTEPDLDDNILFLNFQYSFGLEI